LMGDDSPTTVRLVCGGRDFTDKDRLWATLDALLRDRGGVRVIAGGARVQTRWAKNGPRLAVCRAMSSWRTGPASAAKPDQFGTKRCLIKGAPIWWWHSLAGEEPPTWFAAPGALASR